MAQDLDLLVGRENDNVVFTILIDIVPRQCAGVAFEFLIELLKGSRAIRPAEHEHSPGILLNDHCEQRRTIRFQMTDSHGQGPTFKRQQLGKWQALLFIHPRYPDLALLGAEQEQLGFAVPIPVFNGQVADSCQAGEGCGRCQRAVGLLQRNRELPTIRFGNDKILKAVPVQVSP